MLLLPESLRAHANTVAEALERGDTATALGAGSHLSARRLAGLLVAAPRRHALALLRELAADQAGRLLADMAPGAAAEFVTELPSSAAAACLAHVQADQVADILHHLPSRQHDDLLERLTPVMRQHVQQLHVYPAGTAGAAMRPSFVAVGRGTTAGQALAAVGEARAVRTKSAYIYVTDAQNRLIGVASLRTLALAEPQTPVAELMTDHVVAARAADPADDVAHRIYNRNLKMLPVVDHGDVLIGVIPVETAMGLLTDQVSASFAGLAGVARGETDTTGIAQALMARLPWMAANLILTFVAVSVILVFEGIIAQAAFLAAFIPLMTDTAGNVGIQALTISVRAIALGEARVGAIARRAGKELVLGVVAGVVLGGLAWALGWFLLGNALAAAVVGLALAGTVLIAGLLGGLLPLILKRLRREPTLVTGPLLTTITAIVGVTLYLVLAAFLLAL